MVLQVLAGQNLRSPLDPSQVFTRKLLFKKLAPGFEFPDKSVLSSSLNSPLVNEQMISICRVVQEIGQAGVLRVR